MVFSEELGYDPEECPEPQPFLRLGLYTRVCMGVGTILLSVALYCLMELLKAAKSLQHKHPRSHSRAPSLIEEVARAALVRASFNATTTSPRHSLSLCAPPSATLAKRASVAAAAVEAETKCKRTKEEDELADTSTADPNETAARGQRSVELNELLPETLSVSENASTPPTSAFASLDAINVAADAEAARVDAHDQQQQQQRPRRQQQGCVPKNDDSHQRQQQGVGGDECLCVTSAAAGLDNSTAAAEANAARRRGEAKGDESDERRSNMNVEDVREKSETMRARRLSVENAAETAATINDVVEMEEDERTFEAPKETVQSEAKLKIGLQQERKQNSRQTQINVEEDAEMRDEQRFNHATSANNDAVDDSPVATTTTTTNAQRSGEHGSSSSSSEASFVRIDDETASRGDAMADAIHCLLQDVLSSSDDGKTTSSPWSQLSPSSDLQDAESEPMLLGLPGIGQQQQQPYFSSSAFMHSAFDDSLTTTTTNAAKNDADDDAEETTAANADDEGFGADDDDDVEEAADEQTTEIAKNVKKNVDDEIEADAQEAGAGAQRATSGGSFGVRECCLGEASELDEPRLSTQTDSKRDECCLRSSSNGALQPRIRRLVDLSEALKQAELDSVNLIFGIDYTSSNERQGRHSFGGRSLHFLAAAGDEDAGDSASAATVVNPYQQVIKVISDTLAPFGTAHAIPVFGFGDETSGDWSVFQLPGSSNEKFCESVDEVARVYNAVTPRVRLGDAPTNFAPLIFRAMEICQQRQEYHILVIIADGEVENERATKMAIINACQYPLSIIVVGVGDSSWEMMKVFDTFLPKRPWDNLHFVEFKQFLNERGTMDEDGELAFAVDALVEVPDQYRHVRAMGLV